MAWNRQESRVLTVLTARESGKARERGPGSAQSACGNVAHTKSAGGCKGAKGIGKRLETAKIAFSGLRERAGVSVGRASQQTQSHSLSACCFFKYDLLFFRQEEYSVFHFGPRTLLSARKRGVWQCFCHVVDG